jgi:hypothetical protein
MSKKAPAAHKATPGVARAIPAGKKPPAVPPRTGPAHQPDPAQGDKPFKVTATQLGYYDHVRRRPGDVFTIAGERLFSERWMERVDPRTPDKVSTSQQAINEKHDEILGGKVTGPAGGVL